MASSRAVLVVANDVRAFYASGGNGGTLLPVVINTSLRPPRNAFSVGVLLRRNSV